MNGKIRNILFKAPAIVWGFLLFYFTLLPSDNLPDGLVDVNDKILHALIFFIWTALIILGILRYPIQKSPSKKLLILVMLITISLGGLIEVLQDALITGRKGDWLDFVANSIGALFAVLLWSFIRGRKA